MTLFLLAWLALAPAQAVMSGAGSGVPHRGPGVEPVKASLYLAQLKAFASIRAENPAQLVAFLAHRLRHPESTPAELAAASTILTVLSSESDLGAKIAAKVLNTAGGREAGDALLGLENLLDPGETAKALANLDLSLPGSADAFFDGLKIQNDPVVVPQKPLQGLLLSAKSGPAKVGSSVIVKMGERKLVGVFLGSARRKGVPIHYFFDPEMRHVVWTPAHQIHWDETFEPAPIEIRKQDGPACYANALANCVDYLADLNHAVSPALSREAQAAILKDAIAAMSAIHENGTMDGQDRYALKVLKKTGLGGRLTWSTREIRAHLDRGLPALLALRVKAASTRGTQLWASGQIFGEETPERWLQQYVPEPDKPLRTVKRYGEFVFVTEHKTLHEVLALGRFKADGDAYVIVADSKSGEITAWREDETFEALEGGQILAGAESQSALVVYLRQRGLLK